VYLEDGLGHGGHSLRDRGLVIVEATPVLQLLVLLLETRVLQRRIYNVKVAGGFSQERNHNCHLNIRTKKRKVNEML
jgi:hypothetical protein